VLSQTALSLYRRFIEKASPFFIFSADTQIFSVSANEPPVQRRRSGCSFLLPYPHFAWAIDIQSVYDIMGFKRTAQRLRALAGGIAPHADKQNMNF